MSAAPEPRDAKLIELVAKIYFEYKQVTKDLTLDDFLNLLQDVSSDIKEEIAVQIRNGLLLMALNEALEAAKKARIENLTYREFKVEYGDAVEGALEVPHTVVVYPSGLYAYITTKNTALSPAYKVLGALIRELYRMSTVYREFGPFGIEKRVKDRAKELESYIDLFPEGEIREPQRYDPEWLQRALEAYYIYRGAKFGYRKRSRAEIASRRFKIQLWKLYEVLTLFLLLRVLRKKGYAFQFEDEGILRVSGRGSAFRIYINQPLGGREVVQKVDNISDGIIDSIKGRPDISVEVKNIAFECKYSTSLSYLTAGRFKVLAYIYEYDLSAGVLVSPGISSEASGEQDEEKEAEREGTQKLFRLAEDNNGLLDLKLKNDKMMFILLLDPSKDLDELEGRVERLVNLLFNRSEVNL